MIETEAEAELMLALVSLPTAKRREIEALARKTILAAHEDGFKAGLGEAARIADSEAVSDERTRVQKAAACRARSVAHRIRDLLGASSPKLIPAAKVHEEVSKALAAVEVGTHGWSVLRDLLGVVDRLSK